MSNNINYYKAIQGYFGINSQKEHLVLKEKHRLSNVLKNSINYCTAKVNGIEKPLILIPSKKYNECIVEMLPGDDIFVGDIIENDNQFWMVAETNTLNPIQQTGVLWLCNYKLRFQNDLSTVIEKWVVLKSISTDDITTYEKLYSANKDMIVYLPLDSDTETIYKGKRFAIDYIYDSDGNKMLNTYSVAGYDKSSMNYRNEDHILKLTFESSEYAPEKDNIELCICDYVTEPDNEPQTVDEDSLLCAISGNTKMRIGSTRRYTSTFFEFDNTTITSSPKANWVIYPNIDGVTTLFDNNDLLISVANYDSLIGTHFVISLIDDEEVYNLSKLRVEVTEVG